ncbi:MAG: NAD(P)/FAD-dependent oxidoreductase [Chitinispirillaceae bacterium]
MKSVIIIGGGPSGFSAAFAAASRCAQVTILECSNTPGRKLLASGGGRCNVTNTMPPTKMAGLYHCGGGDYSPSRFVRAALKGFDQKMLRDFLSSYGVQTDVEQESFVYPKSRRASDVLDAWRNACTDQGVQIQTACAATSPIFDKGIITGVNTTKGRFSCDALIIATGGRGYSSLGGTGDGYKLARQCGHRIIKPLPALAPLQIEDRKLTSCAGVSLQGVLLRIPGIGGKPVSFRGDVLITHTGLSGPAALNSATVISRLMFETGKPVPIELSLDPLADDSRWRNRFITWQQQKGNRKLISLLTAGIPKSIVLHIFDRLGLSSDLRASDLPKNSRKDLIGVLVRLPLTVSGTGGFDKSMVTSGGIDLNEIDSRSMRSRLMKNLFFCGEVIDIDGPCGGFNLHWAFSSGSLAGLSAA